MRGIGKEGYPANSRIHQQAKQTAFHIHIRNGEAKGMKSERYGSRWAVETQVLKIFSGIIPAMPDNWLGMIQRK